MSSNQIRGSHKIAEAPGIVPFCRKVNPALALGLILDTTVIHNNHPTNLRFHPTIFNQCDWFILSGSPIQPDQFTNQTTPLADMQLSPVKR